MELRDLGLIDYAECWKLQQEIMERVVAGDAANSLILCEHPHVYTLGRSGDDHNLLIGEKFLENIGAKFYRIDRGGDITYHGPGQLVGYPILNLPRLGLGIKDYIHTLEQSVIDTLSEFGIEAGRREGAAGVWLDACARKPLRKICAIGVRASRGVTMHGFALNVTTDLTYFSHINPCGLAEKGVTSMSQELGKEVDMDEVKRIYFIRLMDLLLTDTAQATSNPPSPKRR